MQLRGRTSHDAVYLLSQRGCRVWYDRQRRVPRGAVGVVNLAGRRVVSDGPADMAVGDKRTAPHEGQVLSRSEVVYLPHDRLRS